MFVTAPPPMADHCSDRPTAALPLRLHTARHRTFPRRSKTAETAGATAGASERYVRDLVESNGGTFLPEVLRTQGGTSFATMARELVSDLGAEWPSVDLVVLAHAVPDVDPRSLPACVLVDISPGTPTAFMICDQGRVAPFSALQVAGAYVAGAQFRRALLLVLDQSTVPWQVDNRGELPTSDVAVALVLDRVSPQEGSAVLVGQHAGVAADQVGSTLRRCLPALVSGSVQVVAGPGVAADQLSGLGLPVTPAPAGLLAASTWMQVSAVCAGRRQHGRPDRLITLDYDARTQYLATAAFDLEGAT